MIDCIDRSGNEPHRQVGMDRVIASGNLGNIMYVNAGMAIDGDLNTALGEITPNICNTEHWLG